MKNITFSLGELLFCITVAFIFGFLVAFQASRTVAVDHHGAHYDSQTGEFKWNDETKD